ncbi:UBX domain-containing protein 1 [Cloeon dipterum]|uniref:UBX domain-containing protein 1 n=1 Tax=Cloeon dipterum TaxID=197152 RepID=UPI0032208D1B
MEQEKPAMESAPPATTDEKSSEAVAAASASDDAAAEAKSLKCNQCGKLFKGQLEVEYHAAKTDHFDFSESTEEIKPLSEEEKQERIRLMEEKIKQKRKEREEQEKVEALEREKIRIKSGKEMIATRRRLEEDEMKKIMDQRKREKMEDQLARQRIKEKIEQDKLARQAKYSNTPVVEPKAPVQPEAPQPKAPPKDYTEAKINIRLTNGQTITQSFKAKEELSAVRLFVTLNRTDGAAPFSMMTSFPRKVFQEDDYAKPLDVLGLVPSAVITVTKAQ